MKVKKFVFAVLLSLLSGLFANCALALPGLVAVGLNGTTARPPSPIYTSPDGRNWTHTSSSLENLYAVAGNRTQWIAVGDNGTILTSSNGTSWTAQTSPVRANFRAVTWAGNQWIVVGMAGVIISSADGVTWRRASVPGVALFHGVAYNSLLNVAVAVGDRGTIVTRSPSGAWSRQENPARSDLKDVTWDPVQLQWVAVGDVDTLIGSPDGTQWTRVTGGPGSVPNFARGVAKGNGLWVAVGNGTYTSADARTWVHRTGDRDLMKVVFFNGLWVGVGQRTIMTSSDGIQWSAQRNADLLFSVAKETV
jgi:hypothetical protein